MSLGFRTTPIKECDSEEAAITLVKQWNKEIDEKKRRVNHKGSFYIADGKTVAFCDTLMCPNGDGQLVHFNTPLLVAPTEAAEAKLDDDCVIESEEDAEPKTYYQAIHNACPKCGYFEVEEITVEEFANYEQASNKPKQTTEEKP